MDISVKVSTDELQIIALGFSSLISILTYKLVKFPPQKGDTQQKPSMTSSVKSNSHLTGLVIEGKPLNLKN